MKRVILAAAMAATLGLLTGCSSGPKTIELVLREMSFNKKEITLKQGETVKLILNNRDKEIHDWNIDTIPVDVLLQTADLEEGHTHSGGKEPDLHVSVKPGQKGWVEFTPLEAGTYTFYCTVDGHRSDHGMEGTLIVK